MLVVNCGNLGILFYGKIIEIGFIYKKVVSYFCDKYFEFYGLKM